MADAIHEWSFDGIVGPTHNYAGLSRGNVASMAHQGGVANPRAAALEGLAKMRLVKSLGGKQAVLPPHERPSLTELRKLGFTGSDEQMLSAAAGRDDGLYLRLCSSAAAMWTANAATVSPRRDTGDGRTHLTAANLSSMFHRSIEASTTFRVLSTIFADAARFAVHPGLPGGEQLADEGAANHTRLSTDRATLHLFAWGRSTFRDVSDRPQRFPARQTREASEAVARGHGLDPSRCLFVQQHPAGIDAGAFHSDVLAVGAGSFLMMHELAFVDTSAAVRELEQRLGPALRVVLARNDELPVADAVAAYPFNSQLVPLPGGGLALLAPAESRDQPASRRFIDRVLAEQNAVAAVHYLDLRQSMQNGGGPACLRLRVPLEEDEAAALAARVRFDEQLDAELLAWVERHYRDRLLPGDLADPIFARECMTAIDELSRMLALGNVYDFQRVGTAS